jgi:hypothetical protein
MEALHDIFDYAKDQLEKNGIRYKGSGRFDATGEELVEADYDP